MKKMRIMVLLVLTLFVGFIVSTNVFAEETTTAATTTAATTTAATTVDVYDTGNLSLALGMITYEDVTLTDGWYHFAIALDGLDNPAGLLTIAYYTGDLSTGYDFYDSTYTDNVDTSTNFEADIYIEDGIFKLVTSETDTFDQSLLESNMTLDYIGDTTTPAADDDADATPGTVIADDTTETASLWGLAWYWWALIGLGVILLFNSKKFRKSIGLK